ncbi:MAG: hypothetical protein GWP17_01325 [Aquificales bacterium]|nr:hypothetical protein [Aquificales bacterium]
MPAAVLAQEGDDVVSTPRPSLVESVTPTPEPAQPTPTVDRLAPPPTVENPTQLDDGAYLYWLYCIPCHGDKGQGLTDEWRAEYPEEDQYCWNSKCHGSNPPEPYGFLIPTVVPPVVTGYGGLERFDTMGQVYYYTRGVMPLELPGKLKDEEYLAIMAFLANEMGLWDGHEFDDRNILQVHIRPETEVTVTPTATLAPEKAEAAAVPFIWPLGVMAAGLLAAFSVGGMIIWQRQNR